MHNTNKQIKITLRGCYCPKCAAYNARWKKFAASRGLPTTVSLIDMHKYDGYNE